MREYEIVWTNTLRVITKKRVLRSTGGSRVTIPTFLENARKAPPLPIIGVLPFATCKKWEGGCGCHGRTDKRTDGNLEY